MHEVGLMQDCLEQALATARDAGATRIVQVSFLVAEGSHLTSETIRTLFGAFSVGTAAEGAEIVVSTATSPTSEPDDAATAPEPRFINRDHDENLIGRAGPELCLESVTILDPSEENPCA